MNRLNNIIISDIHEVVTVYSEEGRVFCAKNRKYYGLSFCQSGEIVYYMKGQAYKSDTTSAIILPAGASYMLKGIQTGYFPIINFSAEMEEDVKEIIRVPVVSREYYLKAFAQIKAKEGDPNGRLESISVLYKMLAELSREKCSIHPAVTAALKYIDENLGNSMLSVDAIAESTNVSPVYLRRLFLKAMGTSPRQYIIKHRIEQAKKLLLTSKIHVNDVAEQCGFSNVYHFSRTFRQCVNETPSAYRHRTESNSLLYL